MARETKNFRNEFFPLLQNKIEAISANNSESNDSELVYRHIRQKLDATPEIQAANQRRSILQDRLWERVAIDIKSECDRLSQEFESYLKIKDKGRLADYEQLLAQLGDRAMTRIRFRDNHILLMQVP